MSERYKVLGAMTALYEFTAEDVAKKTGVKLNTVHTHIARHKHLLEEVGYEETGRRGGQRKKYRIREEAIESVYEELEGLYQSLPARARTDGPSVEQQSQPTELPLGLFTAEETLLHRYPKATGLEEKRHILDLAGLDYQQGIMAAERILATSSDALFNQAVQEAKERIKALQQVGELDLMANSLQVETATGAVKFSMPQIQIMEFRQHSAQVVNALPSLFRPTRQINVSGAILSVNSFRPDSAHYIEARNLMAQLFYEGAENSVERSTLLEQAGTAIGFLQQEYSAPDTPQITQAFIDYEHAKYRYLTQEYARAMELFDRARAVFASFPSYGDEVARIDQYLALLAIDAKPRLGKPTTFWEEVADMAALRQFDKKSHWNPLVTRLRKLLSDVIQEFTRTEKSLNEEIGRLRVNISRLERLVAEKRSSENFHPVLHLGRSQQRMRRVRISLGEPSHPIDATNSPAQAPVLGDESTSQEHLYKAEVQTSVLLASQTGAGPLSQGTGKRLGLKRWRSNWK